MLTQEQIDKRLQRIGASEAAAVLGLSRWSKPREVYDQKVTGVVPDISQKPAVAFGNQMEQGLVDWAADQVGLMLYPDEGTYLDTEDVLAANLDGLAPADRCIIEAKTTSRPQDWEGEPPIEVLTQVHHQAVCVREVLGWVPAIILVPVMFRIATPSGDDEYQPELFRVKPDEEMLDLVATGCRKFWHEHVEKRIPPDGDPDPELWRKVKREEGKVVEVPDDLVAAWVAAREHHLGVSKVERDSKQERDVLLARILEQAGDASVIRCGLGEIVVKTQNRKACEATSYSVFKWKGAE